MGICVCVSYLFLCRVASLSTEKHYAIEKLLKNIIHIEKISTRVHVQTNLSHLYNDTTTHQLEETNINSLQQKSTRKLFIFLYNVKYYLIYSVWKKRYIMSWYWRLTCTLVKTGWKPEAYCLFITLIMWFFCFIIRPHKFDLSNYTCRWTIFINNQCYLT